MRELPFHVEKIAGAIDEEDKERNDAYKGRASKPIRLPLVHRTDNRITLKSIFSDGHLRPPGSPSDREAEFNLEPAVYFFWGAGAYPNGNAALIFYPETAVRESAEFTPFDSGAVGTSYYLEPSVHDPGWSDSKVREVFLGNHTGDCTELNEFSLHYLHAHFREIQDYVTRPQNSDPDWPPYHGLRSPKEPDRRAWTVEVRIPAQVSLKQLETIVLDGDDLTFLTEFDEQLFAEDGLKVIVLEEVEEKVEDSRDPNQAEVNNADPLQRAVSKFIIDKYFFRSIIDNDS